MAKKTGSGAQAKNYVPVLNYAWRRDVPGNSEQSGEWFELKDFDPEALLRKVCYSTRYEAESVEIRNATGSGLERTERHKVADVPVADLCDKARVINEIYTTRHMTALAGLEKNAGASLDQCADDIRELADELAGRIAEAVQLYESG